MNNLFSEISKLKSLFVTKEEFNKEVTYLREEIEKLKKQVSSLNEKFENNTSSLDQILSDIEYLKEAIKNLA